MHGKSRFFAFLIPILFTALTTAWAKEAAVISDTVIATLSHPESIGYDPADSLLYASDFGSVLKPTLKDGEGRVSIVSLEGTILERAFLPHSGDVLHKPKGVTISQGKLWVTDIDAVWEFDIKSRRGKKVSLPDAQFANDTTIMDGVLYVSDSAGDKLYTVEPADFLDTPDGPKVALRYRGLGIHPNGLCAGPKGALVMVGYNPGGEDEGIYALDRTGKVTAWAEKIGALDGLARLDDDTYLFTDWKSGALLSWNRNEGVRTLIKGFEGPADFCLIPGEKENTVVLPDLVTGEVHVIRISR